MFSRISPIFLLSVYLLLLEAGDTSAAKQTTTKRKVLKQTTPPNDKSPLTRCTIGPSDVTLELFDINQLNQVNPKGETLTCPVGKSVRKVGSKLSVPGGSVGSRTPSAKGSTSSKQMEPTVVVMHGFNFNGEKMKAKGFVDAYKKKGVNLIIVDWSRLAKPGVNFNLGYKKAATCAIEVGKYLADCLDKLNVDPKNLRMLGHSLGAHGVGMAGRELAKLGKRIKPSRVTGMDPAGPGFVSPTGFKVSDVFLDLIPHYKNLEKISEDSGDFVDIVHSNPGKYGYAERLGHVDYYVNGGGPIQKNCLKRKMNPLSNPDTRSHEYAINVVVASLQGDKNQNVKICVTPVTQPLANEYQCKPGRASMASLGNFEVDKNPISHGTYEITTTTQCTAITK